MLKKIWELIKSIIKFVTKTQSNIESNDGQTTIIIDEALANDVVDKGKDLFTGCNKKDDDKVEEPKEEASEPAVKDDTIEAPVVKEEPIDEPVPEPEIPSEEEATEKVVDPYEEPKEDFTEEVVEENDNLTEEEMYQFFKNQGMNDFGVSGLMGNLFAESGLRSTNLQNTYEKKLEFTDDEYTKVVDSGEYDRDSFINDKAGYGLAQWTYWTRKRNLLDYAIEQNKSIGSCRMQCNFLMKELTEGYKSVLETLKTATSVREASDAVLLKFERPANQSEEVQEKRASYGMKYYDKYAEK